MGSFLDKVGLQHFVEKIKGLLRGYLPLRGGSMTGNIVYGNSLELSEQGVLYTDVNGGSIYLDETGVGIEHSNSYQDDSYGFITTDKCALKYDGLYFEMESDNFTGAASYGIDGCNTKKFVLSKDSDSEGLIANNSETVVKELSDEQVDKLLAGDTSTISDSKYYVSGANLGRFAQNVAKDKAYTIICAKGGDVKVKTSNGNITIKPGVNYRIDGDYSIIRGKENVDTIVQSGPIQDSNKPFSGMEALIGIDVARLDTSNVTDMAVYFSKCGSLLNFGLFYRDLSGWDTRKVTTFEAMFLGCELATSIMGINVWDTRNVSNMNSVFANCRKLTSLDLSGWSTQSVYSMEMMFSNCSAITSLTLGEGFGRMHDSVGTLDLSALTKWTGSTVDTLLDLYDRKANGMGVITIKLSSATKNALGTDGISTLTAKGYTIA